MKYFCPIVLKNKRLKTVQLAPGIKLTKMNRRQLESFFGFSQRDFVFKHTLMGFIGFSDFKPVKGTKVRCPYGQLLHVGHFNGSSDILAADYLIEIDIDASPDKAIDQANLAFKLLNLTSTGIYLFFRENETDVSFHYSYMLHGPFDYLHLSQKSIVDLKRVFRLLETKNGDARFELCANLFMRALSGDHLSLDLRFLSLCIVLESLYLPEESGAELNFRLALRVANLLGLHKYGRSKEIFERVKKLYKIRSKIIHTGATDDLKANEFIALASIVQISLRLYLDGSNKFGEDYLTSMNFR